MISFSRFFPFLRPHLLQMMGSALLIMSVAALNLVLIRFAGTLWDLITVKQDLAQLTQAMWVFLGLMVTQSLLSMGHSYVSARVSQRIIADFRVSLFSHLQQLSLNFFAKRRTGELVSRLMNDVGVIQHTFTEMPIDSAKHLVTIVGGIGFLLVMNWKLCLLILLLLPLLAIVARLFGKRLKSLSTLIQDRTAGLTTLIEEVISGIRVVKSFVQTGREEGRFKASVEGLMSAGIHRAAILAIFIPTITLLTFSMAIAVLWYGGKQVIEGAMSPGDLFAFVLFAGILIGPFGSAARLFAQIKETQGAMTRVFELLDTQPEIRNVPNASILSHIEGAIQFDRIEFAYDPRHPVLSSVSFTVQPGERIALVGPTGSGKTTIINLLHRFYDPTVGTVYIDGQDLRRLHLDSYYSQIGLVPQETILFGDTIMENIRYGLPGASEKEVLIASEGANAHEFIQTLPDGYHTLVGEKGVNLSGGQRQRIAIARAFLKNPRILIMDEATSALDSQSERLVQSALDRLMEGRTTLIIAHRLSTVQSADRILVLQKGRIIEEGPHQQLLEKKGLYHHLYTLRMAERESADWETIEKQ
ncbi:MAG: ABC transporter ATP-binding protein [Nitrospirota bacterium]|nr:MAG: ABC transporter ATP-binding protein [Nitrospirota bacterium]